MNARSPAIRWTRHALWPVAWALLAGHAQAQANPVTVWQAAPQNVVNLSAEASREVPQDLIAITLAATREGTDAATVQAQLRQVLDAALADARKAARPGALEVRTGGFNLSPRYAGKPGTAPTISGWQGRAELVIEGNDTAAVSQLAGRLTALTVARVGYGLSREARDKVEADVAAQAIGRFKDRAEAHARQFGFASYSLREVSVNGVESGGPAPMYRVAAAPMLATADQAQPVEPGKTTVTVSVNGSIQLSPR
ncbi:MAG: SIMPL domain-containing protein [Aquabacterium sp.]|nr:SIMPL domain-containing protein [Aquabacterium sp.]